MESDVDDEEEEMKEESAAPPTPPPAAAPSSAVPYERDYVPSYVGKQKLLDAGSDPRMDTALAVTLHVDEDMPSPPQVDDLASLWAEMESGSWWRSCWSRTRASELSSLTSLVFSSQAQPPRPARP